MKNIYFDMDGTIADFYNCGDCLERMYEEDFFANLPTLPIVTAIQKLLLEYPDNIFILSACITKGCKMEKRQWVRKNLVDMKYNNVIFCEVGENKSKYVNDMANSVLIDDYTKNLKDWLFAGGQIVKANNKINCINTPIYNTMNVYDSRECYNRIKELIESK